jgi:aspartate carbamoyltransferase catalytic subunit
MGWISSGIINAGDGTHEHPTQALLDALTIQQCRGVQLDGLRVLIVGDLLHSRVARSNVLLLRLLGADITLAGPESLLPKGFEQLGASVSYNFDDSLGEQPDVVMMLRVQRERMLENFSNSEANYIRDWALSRTRLQTLPRDCLIMHPGPINRGLEICSEAADDPRSTILQQVKNGVAIRMAVLHRLLAGDA